MKNDQELTIKERKRKKMFGKRNGCLKKNIVTIFMFIFKNKNSKAGIKKINHGFHHLNTNSIKILSSLFKSCFL